MICLGGIQGLVGWDLGQPDIATGNSAHGRGFKRRKEDCLEKKALLKWQFPLCQVGLSTFTWAGDHQQIIGSFKEKF